MLKMCNKLDATVEDGGVILVLQVPCVDAGSYGHDAGPSYWSQCTPHLSVTPGSSLSLASLFHRFL